MNNIPYDVRKALYDALDGNVTYNGQEVPIHTVLPKASALTYPYIHIESIDLQDDSSQGSEEGIVDVVFDIISTFGPSSGGYHVVDNIEQQLWNLVQNAADGASNYLIVIKFVSSTSRPDYDGRTIMRKRVTIEVQTQQK